MSTMPTPSTQNESHRFSSEWLQGVQADQEYLSESLRKRVIQRRIEVILDRIDRICEDKR